MSTLKQEFTEIVTDLGISEDHSMYDFLREIFMAGVAVIVIDLLQDDAEKSKGMIQELAEYAKEKAEKKNKELKERLAKVTPEEQPKNQ